MKISLVTHKQETTSTTYLVLLKGKGKVIPITGLCGPKDG